MPRRAAEPDVIGEVNRRFPGALIKASDPSLRIEHLPTGILAIDAVVGGFARGRHTELFGGYNVGKTATTYKFIGTNQRAGARAAFLDVEGTFDPAFAEHLGVDLRTLDFPDHGLNANRLVNIMEALLRSHEYDIIVLDSIAALMPAAEENADMEAGSYGTQQAKLMSQALRRLTAANKRTALIYINQTREAIGGLSFGKRTITSGGRAMPFYAATRLEMNRIETIKRRAKSVDTKTNKDVDREVVCGHRVLVRVEKDKTGAVKQAAETTFVFDYDRSEFDDTEDLIYLGRLYGLITVRGDRWTLGGYEDESAAGRKRFKKWLAKNRAVAEELEETIRERPAEMDGTEADAAEAEPEVEPARARPRKTSGRKAAARKRKQPTRGARRRDT